MRTGSAVLPECGQPSVSFSSPAGLIMMINFQVISSNAITLIRQENPLHHSKPRLGQTWEAVGGGTELVTRVKREKQDSAPALRLEGLIPRSSGGLRSQAPQMGLPGLTQLPHCWGEENGFSWTSGKAEAAVLPTRSQEELTQAPAGA